VRFTTQLLDVPTLWRRALTLVSAALFATSVSAADPAPESAPGPAPAPEASTAPAGRVAPAENNATKELAYRVVIVAPSSIKSAIERSVSLERWQNYADMTVELLDRLAREAKEEARNAAAAEGYFAAQVDYAVDRDVKPPVVMLTVTPGEPSRIAKVDIDVTGPATTDAPLGTKAIATLTAEWSLPKGEIFQQSAWSAAKARALATLRASPYAAAKIERSEAYVDPDARTADLSIELASGPPFRFGAFDVTGLTKYPTSIVTNYSTMHPGDPYDQAALEQFIRRLNSTGYFASVQAAIDPASTHPEDATVQVAVVEAPTKTFEGGIGYSTDVRYTAKLNYRDVNIDGKGLQLLADGQLDGNIQSASLRLVQPANASGWIGTWVVSAGGTDIEGLVTRTEFAGTRWYTLDERRQTALSATYYNDEQSPDNAPSSNSHALYLEVEHYIREVDQLLSPTRGWMVSGQAGGGIPGASTRGFGRAVGRFAAWYPIDAKNQLYFRGDAGVVFASSRDGIPSPLLFRTGGDTTVRVYAFQSLGVQEGNAIVGGRYYAVASAEATHWIGEAWGLAAFVDAGNAGDSLSGLSPVLGYGVGVRVRTPLGPFRLDLAYGQEVHQVRLHFSVGLSF
jgi:translocation and assembly module TamA